MTCISRCEIDQEEILEYDSKGEEEDESLMNL
jgi:hypothetical protein